MKKGFTLVELTVVVSIVAVLASIAIPRMLKARQKIAQRQAEGYLRSVRISQKMYYARYAAYACATTCSGASAIKSTLGTQLSDGVYTFSVCASSANSFVGTATGAGALGTITIDQDGNFQKNAVPYVPPS